MGRSRERRLTPAEQRLWRLVVKDAVPLPGRTLAEEPEAVAAPLPAPAAAPPRPAPLPAAPPPRAKATYEPLAHGQTAGVDRRTADRLKRGQMDIEARIDLHGMTQEAAHSALTGFLLRCHAAGLRCVLVITGKGLRDGHGVLRHAVPRWLNEPRLRPAIVTFAHAQQRDGGEGALYVLLRRQR